MCDLAPASAEEDDGCRAAERGAAVERIGRAMARVGSGSVRERMLGWIRRTPRSARGSARSAPQVPSAPRPARPAATAPTAAPRTTGETAVAISAILVPTGAALSALAFWFGWTLTNARSSYFGIDASVLGFSATDFVLRSADAMLVPALLVLLLALIALVVHTALLLLMASSRGHRILRAAALAGLAAGALAVLTGGWRLVAPLPFAAPPLLTPVLLGAGGIVVAYAVWLLRALAGGDPGTHAVRRMAMWDGLMFATAAALAFVCLFWGTSQYARALGESRAEVLAASLDQLPTVTVYSRDDLALGAPVRSDAVTSDADAAYRYRYTGLRLITYSAGRYFLVTEGWTASSGSAIVLPDTDGIRYEFGP